VAFNTDVMSDQLQTDEGLDIMIVDKSAHLISETLSVPVRSS
jgi:hypothetical protein